MDDPLFAGSSRVDSQIARLEVETFTNFSKMTRESRETWEPSLALDSEYSIKND